MESNNGVLDQHKYKEAGEKSGNVAVVWAIIVGGSESKFAF